MRTGPIASVALAVVLVVVTVVGVVLVRPESRRAARTAELAAVAARFETELVRHQAAADRLANTVPGRLVAEANRLAAGGDVASVLVLDGEGRPTSAVGADVAEVADAAVVQRARDRARDDGRAVFVGRLDATADGTSLAAWVAPIVDPATTGPTLDARRAATNGWVMTLVAVTDLLAAAADDALVPVAVTDGDTVITGPSPPDGAASVAVGPWEVVLAGTWSIWDGEGLFWVIVALVIGAAGVAVALWQDRRTRSADGDRAEEQRRLETVADAAPLLQTSLDPGAVLPAFGVHLSDRFDLRGLVVLLLDDGGALVPTFTMGQPGPPVSALPASRRPDEVLDAGDSTAVALRRAGRAFGALQLRAGRDLSARDIDAVIVLADMLSAALSNAIAHAQEQTARAKLDEVDRLKTEFLGTVSHELRTSSTTIGEFAKLLAEHWEDFAADERQMFAGRIQSNAEALSRLVAQLLDFSRLDRFSFAVHAEPMNLSTHVLALVDRLTPVVDGRPLEVDVDEHVGAIADEDALERILTNFLTNAVRYSPDGTPIAVRVARRTDGAALLQVDDAGSGIAEAERSRVFERFYRGSSDPAMRTRGAGIGLALVRELADKMEATVRVTDSPLGGARFEVAFRPASLAATATTSTTTSTEAAT